jgi:hypothetical protein
LELTAEIVLSAIRKLALLAFGLRQIADARFQVEGGDFVETRF